MLPMLLGIERHELDEPQLQARARGRSGASGTISGSVMPRMATALRRIFSKAGALGGGDAGQHAVEPVAAGDLVKRLFAERVEADVEPLQAGVLERLRPARPAGCRWSSGRGRRCRAIAASCATSRGRSARTSGSPPVSRSLLTPSLRHDAHEPRDLLEREDLVPRLETARSRSACSRSSGCCSDR